MWLFTLCYKIRLPVSPSQGCVTACPRATWLHVHGSEVNRRTEAADASEYNLIFSLLCGRSELNQGRKESVSCNYGSLWSDSCCSRAGERVNWRRGDGTLT